MDPLKKTLTSRTLRRGAPLIVQKQWGGEGGSGLLESLDGLLLAGTGLYHHGSDHQQAAGPAQDVAPDASGELNIIVREIFFMVSFSICTFR